MININATNIKLNKTITRYINNRLSSIIKKFAGNKEVSCFVKVGKTTNHHKKGDVFMAEINLSFSGDNYFATSEKNDLYLAIDSAKEDIIRKITQVKGKRKTLFKRGALSIKKMVKGISKRNPFTSKY